MQEGFAKYLPGRVEILDFHHVSERLGEIAKATFGSGAAGERAARQWREAQEQELQAWGPRKLLEALEAWEPGKPAGPKVRGDQLRYFRHQRERLNYPEHLRQGFPIGVARWKGRANAWSAIASGARVCAGRVRRRNHCITPARLYSRDRT